MIDASKTKVALYLLAIFTAGALAGGAGAYHLARQQNRSSSVQPDELANRITQRMQSRLHLTAQQMKQIEPDVDRVCAQLRSIGHNSALETGRAFDRFNQQIAGILTPDQRAELEKLQSERKESVKKRCKSWTNAAPVKAAP